MVSFARASLVTALALVLFSAGAARAGEVEWVRAGAPGRSVCGVVPPGWNQPAFDDAAWGEWAPAPPDAGVVDAARPLVPLVLNDGGAPDGGALMPCVARFSRWRFDASGVERLATLAFRIRYSHGFVAYLNGFEIARRRYEPGAPFASDWHGPEWERIAVPPRQGLLRERDNVLAVEVHARSVSYGPFVDVALSGADGPRIIHGPWLHRLGERAVTIRFETDLPTVGSVELGATDAYGQLASEQAPCTRHALTFRDLAPGTVYNYRVTARAPLASAAVDEPGEHALVPAAPSVAATFHTLPGAGRPLRFVVYGDVRAPGHDVHAALDRAILDEDPDLILVTGDLVDRGSDEGDWDKFFDVGGPLLARLALLPAVGNHEYARLGQGLPAYLALFRDGDRPDGAYYSFDAAGIHFVAIDSNQYRSPAQLAWLDRDLAAARARRARAIFVYAHEAPYSTGLHGDNQTAIHDYVPLFLKYKITAFFGGHDHHYERGRVGALDYFISGGGGAELRAPRCGVPGKRRCPPRVLALAHEHHYVLVEALPAFARVCAKRPDASLIEPCVTIPFKR